jgi:hypothetical protein
MSGPLLTVSQCAQRLAVSECWVRRNRLRLGAVYLGRSLRFPLSAVESLCTSSSSRPMIPGAERSLKQAKGDDMLQRNRYQRGSVWLYKGKSKRVWYGMWREDVVGADGQLRRRQRNQRLGLLQELPTKAAARARLREIMGAPRAPETEMTFSELVEQFEKLQVPTMKASTGRYRLRMLKSNALAAFNLVMISRVTRLDVEALIVRESKKYSESGPWSAVIDLAAPGVGGES